MMVMRDAKEILSVGAIIVRSSDCTSMRKTTAVTCLPQFLMKDLHQSLYQEHLWSLPQVSDAGAVIMMAGDAAPLRTPVEKEKVIVMEQEMED